MTAEMNMKLDHIGIAVRSIEKRLDIWKNALGLTFVGIEEIHDQKVKVAKLDARGTKIELLEPTDKDSPIFKFIEKRGEAIHHLCFQVPDIEKALTEIKDQGIGLIDEVPRIGAGGHKIAFIHPKDMGGVLIELLQK
jgi:methylmalonyl-CoA/ethylmalonyl-CoA epimerase